MRSLRKLFELGGHRVDETFIVHGDRTISYGALLASCRAAATEMATVLLRSARETVSLSRANCPERRQTFWSTVPLGAVLVGLNGWWKATSLPTEMAIRGQACLSRIVCCARVGAARGCRELRVVYLIDAEPD